MKYVLNSEILLINNMQDKKNQKTIIFFGMGSIGNKHARILKKYYSNNLVTYKSNKGQEKNDLDIRELYNLQDAFDLKPDIAFITNPTYLHIETAYKCAKENIHLFIEKPISHNLKNVDNLR